MTWRINNGREKNLLDGKVWIPNGPSSEESCGILPAGLSGSTGPDGPTGQQGIIGPTGQQGITGLTGPPGIQGDQGVVGIQGPTGSPSYTGPTGPPGVNGPQGQTGYMGDMGLTGNIGLTGPQGLMGQMGVTGDPGPPGVTGFTGPNGQLVIGMTGMLTADPVLQYNVAGQYIYYGDKTFIIDHPLDAQKYLVHACLEGPEAGVYYRGTASIKEGYTFAEIYLADYVEALAMEFTVYVTPIVSPNMPRFEMPRFAMPRFASLITSKVQKGKFKVYSNVVPCEFDYLVMGKRQNINVEPEKNQVMVKGEGPYKWI